mmetsp:Transcript_21808/g.61386  ORF Transcript_21808/g.61386 Transcript_21808/m.61386 type:complete len:144 (-) Transcript_21808:94-525(-)
MEFFEGRGRKVWPDGTVYDGEWKAGRKHGYGILEEANGRRYEGAWRDGQRHGVGSQIFDASTRYEGRWENGLQHGSGKYVRQKDGVMSAFEGRWVQGSYHGAGTFRGKDGLRETLEYCHGALLRAEALPPPSMYTPLPKGGAA